MVGTVKQVGNDSREITQADRDDIWNRYLKLQPQLKVLNLEMANFLCIFVKNSYTKF